MRRIVVILSVLMTGSLASMAQSATDSIPFDTLAADKVVDAISPDTLPADVVQGLIAHLSEANTAVDGVGLAPRRASGTKTLLDSSIVVDQNDVPVRKLIYEYDRLDRNFRTTTYYYTGGVPNGTSSVQEKVFDGTSTASTIMTTNYTWDGTRWRGTTRTETVYNDARKQIALITYTWNTAYAFWTPTASTTYQYEYNATKRTYYQTEKWDYAINAASKKLVASQRLEQAFDAQGNNILKTYYKGGVSNNAWQHANNDTKDSAHWAYFGTAYKQTLSESYTWDGTNHRWKGKNSGKTIWNYTTNGSKTTETIVFNWNTTALRYDTATATYKNYDAAGHEISSFSYKWTNGVKSGVQGERNIYTGNDKDSSITYQWINDHWAIKTERVTLRNEKNNPIMTHSFSFNKNTGIASSGTASYTYYLADESTISSLTNYAFSAGQLMPKDSTKYVYSGNTQIGTEVYTWDKSIPGWAASEKTESVSHGDTTINITYQWQDDAWSPNEKTEIVYSGTNILSATTYKWINDAWTYISRTVNSYSNGTLSLSLTQNYENDTWVMVSGLKYETIYNDAHLLLRSSNYSCGDDSVWICQKETRNTYNAANAVLLAEYLVNRDGALEYDYKVENEYDAAGHLILTRRMDWVNNAWKGMYYNEYLYDAFGNKIVTTNYIWNVSKWKGLSKVETVYDATGTNVLYTIDYSWDSTSDTWYRSSKSTSIKDETGKMTEQIYQTYDSETDTWLNTYKYEYAYHGSETSKNNYYKWFNGDWTFITQSEKTFTENGLVKTVISSHWQDGSIVSYEKTTNYYNNE